MSEIVTAWSIHDWTRQGIRQVQGTEHWSGDLIGPFQGPCVIKKGFWFKTRAEAVSEAERRRVELIKKAKKQIERLEKLKFE